VGRAVGLFGLVGFGLTLVGFGVLVGVGVGGSFGCETWVGTRVEPGSDVWTMAGSNVAVGLSLAFDPDGCVGSGVSVGTRVPVEVGELVGVGVVVGVSGTINWFLITSNVKIPCSASSSA
jgi:hypothetical protein